MKKLIVFDLDGTLAASKSPLDAEMALLLHDLLGVVKVAIISGGAWLQFETQVLSMLPQNESLARLSILPTCGTQFFQYTGDWKKLYSEDFTADQKEKIVSSLKKAIATAALKSKKPGEKQSKTGEAKLLIPRSANRRRWKKKRNGISISPSGRRLRQSLIL
jgi:hydroxymethylpyrimidine pyrophosphatase-like HAD family hydrolase